MPSRETIPDLVQSAGDRFGQDEAIAVGGTRLALCDLAERTRLAAGAFRAAGIGAGDRVALWAPNTAR
jgi:non-ribosomal peptide synthetase component E (peptide arylation enzyme)